MATNAICFRDNKSLQKVTNTLNKGDTRSKYQLHYEKTSFKNKLLSSTTYREKKPISSLNESGIMARFKNILLLSPTLQKAERKPRNMYTIYIDLSVSNVIDSPYT